MSKIPTADEFFNKYSLEEYDEGGYLGLNEKEGRKMLIEFAKLHVEAALEAAEKQVQNCNSQQLTEAFSQSILNAYPDKLII